MEREVILIGKNVSFAYYTFQQSRSVHSSMVARFTLPFLNFPFLHDIFSIQSNNAWKKPLPFKQREHTH